MTKEMIAEWRERWRSGDTKWCDDALDILERAEAERTAALGEDAERIAILRKPAASWPLTDTRWMIDSMRMLLAERDEARRLRADDVHTCAVMHKRLLVSEAERDALAAALAHLKEVAPQNTHKLYAALSRLPADLAAERDERIRAEGRDAARDAWDEEMRAVCDLAVGQRDAFRDFGKDGPPSPPWAGALFLRVNEEVERARATGFAFGYTRCREDANREVAHRRSCQPDHASAARIQLDMLHETIAALPVPTETSKEKT